VEHKAEHGQRSDGHEGQEDDPNHLDRSPFAMS
jgi:hypothetical protein